jgi:orotate phosphoribosyltransferase
VTVLPSLPASRGHFRLESGYHTDCWISLDALFVDPAGIAPLIHALAEKFRPHRATGVCGPLLGGAFLAQALAQVLGVRFYYTQPDGRRDTGLFTAAYRLPDGLVRSAAGQRFIVVDDAISAGSSVRATIAAVEAAGASVVGVGALIVLGAVAAEHFGRERYPLEALERLELSLWEPRECPMCAAGTALQDRA